MTHYKLYLVSKVAAKINGDDDLEPENFRGEGAQTSKKKKKRCLNFSENEFEVTAEEPLRERPPCLGVVDLILFGMAELQWWFLKEYLHMVLRHSCDTIFVYAIETAFCL